MTKLQQIVIENPESFQDVIDDETFRDMKDHFNQLWDVEVESFRNTINDPKYEALRREGY